jgi:hypothetical protein
MGCIQVTGVDLHEQVSDDIYATVTDPALYKQLGH